MPDTLTADSGTLKVLEDYVALEIQKRDLKDRLDAIEMHLAALEPTVIDTMCDAGMQSTRIDGLTLYIQTQIWASAVDTEALAQYEDTAFMVVPRVNGNKLSAWVREQKRDDDGNPILSDVIKDAIKVTQKVNARTRKA